MTKQERFAAIKRVAHRMLGEMEWNAFLSLPPRPREAIGELVTALGADGEVQRAACIVLDGMLAILEAHIEEIPCVQEIELEAAGLVQSAFKAIVRRVLSSDGFADCLYDRFIGLCLTTKFRTVP